MNLALPLLCSGQLPQYLSGQAPGFLFVKEIEENPARVADVNVVASHGLRVYR